MLYNRSVIPRPLCLSLLALPTVIHPRASTSHTRWSSSQVPSLPVCSLSPPGGAGPPQWRGAPCRHSRTPPGLIPPNYTPSSGFPTLTLCTTISLHARTHPAISAPLLPSRTPSLRGTHDNARHHTDGLPCLFLSACIRLHLSPSPATLSPNQVDDTAGCPAGCAVDGADWWACWVAECECPAGDSSCLACPVQGSNSCAARTLLAACRGWPRQLFSIFFPRLQNLGPELPYGSGMAYGRCDRVLDSIYPPSPHTSPG